MPLNGIMERRLSLLLDAGSFSSDGPAADTEIVGGTGTIGGRRVCVIAVNPAATVLQDPFTGYQRELALLDRAAKERIPLIHLADRPARVAMGTTAIPLSIMRTFISRDGAGGIFAGFARLSGVVPRVAVVFSPIATTLTYPVAECDLVVMLNSAGMSLARPDMVRLMTGDESPYGEYGGAGMHAGTAGTCDLLAGSEEEALARVREYISLFPGNYGELPPKVLPALPGPAAPGAGAVPSDLDLPFDMAAIISAVVDKDSFFPHRELYAREVITAFARVGGMPVAIIANNPMYRGGILFPETCRKMAAFATLADAFNFPLVFLADTPGFMVGKTAEQGGIIQHGALLFSTLANLSVPHICVVVRKAYTAGLYAMGGPGFGPARFSAFPQAHITIYGPKALRLLACESHMGEEAISALEDEVRITCSTGNYIRSGDLDRVTEPGELRQEIMQFAEAARMQKPTHREPRRVLCL